MKIGIDLSQIAYQNTGVANYLENLTKELVKNENHDFILFFSSLRRDIPNSIQKLSERENVEIKRVKLPPTALHFLWNRLHKIPIENFVGEVDLFISSDWTEPPAKKS